MLEIRYWKFEQAVAQAVWEVNNVPEGAMDPSILEIKTDGGAIIQPDDQQLAPYGIELVFGVTPVAGTAIGKYFVDVPDNQTISTGANNVTISVVQNGGPSEGATF